MPTPALTQSNRIKRVLLNYIALSSVHYNFKNVQHVAYFYLFLRVKLCFWIVGTSSPSTPDARLLSSIPPPDQRGPILSRVVKMKLYKDASCEHAFDLEDLAITMLVNTRFMLNFRCFSFYVQYPIYPSISRDISGLFPGEKLI